MACRVLVREQCALVQLDDSFTARDSTTEIPERWWRWRASPPTVASFTKEADLELHPMRCSQSPGGNCAKLWRERTWTWWCTGHTVTGSSQTLILEGEQSWKYIKTIWPCSLALYRLCNQSQRWDHKREESGSACCKDLLESRANLDAFGQITGLAIFVCFGFFCAHVNIPRPMLSALLSISITNLYCCFSCYWTTQPPDIFMTFSSDIISHASFSCPYFSEWASF